MFKFFLLILFFSFSIAIAINPICRNSEILNPKLYQRAFTLSSNQSSSYMPYFSNVDLLSSPQPLSNVTILVHGLNRDAVGYFCQGMAFSQNQIIVAPFFRNESVSISDWLGVPTEPDLNNPYWNTSEWSEGGLDLQYTLSSFEIMDQFISFIQKKLKNKTEKIIIAGFSAGAQFVQRYAWASDIGIDGSVRFFVSNPSSYVYFNDIRPLEECRPLDSSYEENCLKYSIPDSMSLESSLECRRYNRYKYGILKVDPLNRYLTKAANRSTFDMIGNYTQKEILYVLGNWDVCNCKSEGFDNNQTICYPLKDDASTCLDTYPDSKENALDSNCQAMLQGSHRFQRGLNFLNYLKYLCGGEYVNHYAIVDKMEHDSAMYFKSNFFQDFGFGRKALEKNTDCKFRQFFEANIRKIID